MGASMIIIICGGTRITALRNISLAVVFAVYSASCLTAMMCPLLSETCGACSIILLSFFYFRDGYQIGITEPRRVAAISMSKRVGEELNLTQK